MRQIRRAVLAMLIAVPALVAAPATVHATLLSWSGTVAGDNVAGTVDFQVVGGNLQITLENTSSWAPDTTAQILTGLLFDISGYTTPLGMQSATAVNGTVLAGSTSPTSAGLNICATGIGGTALTNTCGSTLAGGWEAGYWAGGAGSGFSQQYGIATAGLGLFSGNPGDAGNANYGIAPSVGTTTLDGLENMDPYSFGRATFTLYGLTALPDTITILHVQALYGTALADIQPPNVVPPAGTVSEPGALALFGVGLIGLGVTKRKRAG